MAEATALTRQEFGILSTIITGEAFTQRDLADKLDISLGSINKAYRDLCDSGLIEDGAITKAGIRALEPYKVDNAIIMAAGISSRFAPISYERPKGVLKVKGEILIERQIRQLKEAGIDDITVVVGYMKEQFFYLEDKFGVKIAVNEVYSTRNNNSTLMLVRNKLGNTYVCSSDDYFTENVFRPYVYEAYYSAEFFEGETNEYCLTVGPGKRIKGVSVGGHDAYAMLGHVYFDRAFSKEFVEILEDEYERPETYGKLWEDIFKDHLDTLYMVMHPYEKGVINEFDSLEELRGFDPDFVDNVDSQIFDNICDVLGCSRSQISSVVPIKKGLTNLSFKFKIDDRSYVYRHPGPNTSKIINRQSETFSEGVAYDLGIDDTFIHEDPDGGWKISYFIEDCVPFDYHNPSHVEEAMYLAHKLHSSGAKSSWSFDMYSKTEEIIDMLDAGHKLAFQDFSELLQMADEVHDLLLSDKVEPCLCHNDLYDPNFLVSSDRIRLIDWEYSGNSDYANDLGTFICCSDFTYEEAVKTLEVYFGQEPTPAELRHCIGGVCISSFYWFVWALYQDASDKPVGEYLYHWYRYAKEYGKRALELYKK